MRFAVDDSAYVAAFLSEPVGWVTQLFPYSAGQGTRFGPGEHTLLPRQSFPGAAPRASGARYVMLVARQRPALNLSNLHGLVAGYEGTRVTDRSLSVMRPDE